MNISNKSNKNSNKVDIYSDKNIKIIGIVFGLFQGIVGFILGLYFYKTKTNERKTFFKFWGVCFIIKLILDIIYYFVI